MAIFLSIVEDCGGQTPTLDAAARWRSAVLEAYDREIDDLNPKGGFKEAHRRELEIVFDRLDRVCRPPAS